MKPLFEVDITNNEIINKIIIISDRYIHNNTVTERFQLIEVKGFYDGDQGSVTPPKECDPNLLPTAPGNLFCINSTSGDIYATQQTDKGSLSGQTYDLTILGRYLQTQKIYRIQIKFNDVCGSANKILQELKGCYKIDTYYVSLDSNKKWNLHFLETIYSFRILGITLSSQIFNSGEKNYELVVEHQKPSRKFIFPFKVEDPTSDVYISAYELNLNTDDSKYVFELKSINSEGNRSTLHSLKDKSIAVLVSENWSFCRNSDCLNKFKKWNNTRAGGRCKDKDFLQVYYGRCTS